MADVLDAASSARSKCRACGDKIAKGELRFGEELPNPFAEGTSLFWFHLHCAACLRPEKFLPALAASMLDIPERGWLVRSAEVGAAHRRLPRLAGAERSKSSRARCRSCREPIGEGVWRLALHMFEEGRVNPSGYIHVDCAENYFGTSQIADRLARLTPGLRPADLAELERELQNPRPAPSPPVEADPSPEAQPARLAKAGSPPESPPLAKTQGAPNRAKPAVK